MGTSSNRIEIRKEFSPKRDELFLLDNHSLLNLFNILERQLEGLNALLTEKKFKSYSQFCVNVLMELSEGNLAEKIPSIEKKLDQLGALIKGLIESESAHLEFFRGILETIEVAHTRLSELGEDRLGWRDIPCDEFRSRLNQFLSATERVSRGKFRFVFPPEDKSPLSYKIDFQIRSQNKHLKAPPVLHDTIRDIVGNARKYSPPGTEIKIRLEEIDAEGIQLTVADGGIGIPETELEKVVDYGYRATNAMDRNTMGGGLGLTKAYLLTRNFNGRFFIESSENEGTLIQLSLYPPS
jgi:signal transduction histidine kinase